MICIFMLLSVLYCIYLNSLHSLFHSLKLFVMPLSSSILAFIVLYDISVWGVSGNKILSRSHSTNLRRDYCTLRVVCIFKGGFSTEKKYQWNVISCRSHVILSMTVRFYYYSALTIMRHWLKPFYLFLKLANTCVEFCCWLALFGQMSQEAWN